MALNTSNLRALSKFSPSSILGSTLAFLEFLKYETDDLRNEKVIEKKELVERFSNISKQISKKSPQLKKSEIEKDFENFAKELDSILILKNEEEVLSEVQWEKLIEICDLFRRIEKSDERKVRWALYYLFSKGTKKIPLKEIKSLLQEFKIKNIEKIITKILKIEYGSGLDAKFDGKILEINHEPKDRIAAHYLADALEEESRRHPGELEEEILQLLDEGSYSNQEISKILSVDEAMVSRSISKLRNKNKLVLSSFGTKGSRYYTTNCENCPFGKTISSCRKDALSYIINSMKEDFGIDLSVKDFDEVETNQALLQMKRIFMMSKKEGNTRLEKNLNENLNKLLSKVVTKSLEVKTPSNVKQIPQVKMEITSNIRRLPFLYLMGLHQGAQSGVHLIDEILKMATKSVNKEDRLKIRKHAIDETNKFMKSLDIS